MRFFCIILPLLMGACNQAPDTPLQDTVNATELVETRQVIEDGEPWTEITISQRVSQTAPTYIVGLREDKWANRLRWGVFEQSIGPGKVVTRLRIQMIGDTKNVRLTRDDFEWFPRISGFPPIDIAKAPTRE